MMDQILCDNCLVKTVCTSMCEDMFNYYKERLIIDTTKLWQHHESEILSNNKDREKSYLKDVLNINYNDIESIEDRKYKRR